MGQGFLAVCVKFVSYLSTYAFSCDTFFSASWAKVLAKINAENI